MNSKHINPFIIVILLLISFNATAQSFVKKQGFANDITISPKDGSVYIIGTSKNVFKYNTGSKSFKPFGKQSKNAKSITVHPNGSLYMVSTSNEVYIDVNGRWNKIPGIKANEVDIDKKGNVRALNTSGRVFKLFQGKWQTQSQVNKGNTGFNQVIGQDSKTLFARFKDNEFKQFKSGKWQTLNGSPLKISIDDKTGDVYAIGRNKGVYKWNKATKRWVLLKGTRKDFKDVAIHNGKIWVIANDNSIYNYDKNKKPSDEKSKDYSGTYRVTYTRIMGSTKTSKIDKTIYLYGTMGIYLEGKIKSGSISIKPVSNKKNRAWDVSKSGPLKMKNINITTLPVFISDSKKEVIWDNIDRELEIDRIREFKISGEAANDDLTFDFQTNIKWKRAIDELDYEWQREKYNIKDIKLGKEYFIRLTPKYNLDGNWVGLFVGYKIEKL